LVLAKVQVGALQRPTNKSFYVNIPAAISEALNIEKGEEFEWTIEDKNTLVLKQVTQTAILNRANFKQSYTD
jgi:antitoxin component of MazEF toxin-antitoxin module